MKRGSLITVILLIVGGILCLRVDWDFYMKTGHFISRNIVEKLNAPVGIQEIQPVGLKTTNGRLLAIEGSSSFSLPPSIAKDIMDHGVEIQPDGSLIALLRIHHWCGNDPVRYHLARINLASLLLLLRKERFRVSEYGIDPGIVGLASIPYSELVEIFFPAPSNTPPPLIRRDS